MGFKRNSHLHLVRGGVRRSAGIAACAAGEIALFAGLQYETELFVTCFASDDKREGVAAFLEKRPASFTGR
jgi:enoyl-CoA hydratase/carnithine racemase